MKYKAFEVHLKLKDVKPVKTSDSGLLKTVVLQTPGPSVMEINMGEGDLAGMVIGRGNEIQKVGKITGMTEIYAERPLVNGRSRALHATRWTTGFIIVHSLLA